MSTNQVETQAQELASALSCDGDFLYECAYTPNIRWIRAAVPKKVSQIGQRFFLCCGRLLFDIPFQISQTVVDTRTANYINSSSGRLHSKISLSTPINSESSPLGETRMFRSRKEAGRSSLSIQLSVVYVGSCS